MLTPKKLNELRDSKRDELRRLKSEKDAIISVGMGTCGIAAGAEKTYRAIEDKLQKSGFENVVLKQTGCMGLCYSEPTVEVSAKDMPTVVYGRIDAEQGRNIVNTHLAHGELLDKHIYDKPAADLLAAGTED